MKDFPKKINSFFRTITTAYFRGAQGIVLVYDVTDPSSFDNIRNWMSNLQQNASPDVQKILVGNKCDMADRRVISTQRGQDLANEYGISFFETSAKSSSNVNECFMALANDCFNHGSPDNQTNNNKIVLGKTNVASTKGECPC